MPRNAIPTAAKERLNEHRHRLELEQKLKTSLAASAIAHEINQPLSRILMTSQLVLEESSRSLSNRENLIPFLKELSSEAHRVVTTIEKMKGLLRTVAGPQSPLDLRNIVDASVLYCKPFLHSGAIDLHFERPARRARLTGSADQIQIALINILRNAIDAVSSLPRASPRQILVKLDCTKEQITLLIGDSGPGLQQTEIRDLLMKSTKPDGSGIGLHIVQTTMENHGGRLEIGRSSLGGAEFRMVFPREGEKL